MSSIAICSTPDGYLPSPAPGPCSRSRPRPQLTLPSLQTWSKRQGPSLNGAALTRSGLHTPPGDDMGTTYQPPNVMPYENSHHASLPGYGAALAQADRKRTALSDAQAALNYTRLPASQTQTHPALLQSQARQVLPSQPSSRHSTRPSTPASNPSQLEDGISRRDSAMVTHSLEIPVCISSKGGSLSAFAAQLTCFFWFETIQVQQTAEKVELLPPPKRIPRLQTHAIPQPNFKKWVLNILSTTQVTQNVILLALLFIHRLKVTTLGVKGKPGSEYRLLTVALMLGNKFLDDNTYTNKTWAEVSGITVKEIHIMEVEFLSNMRYNLLVSKGEWENWLVKLSKFWEYCERATMPPASPLVIPSPGHRAFVSPLPSPTATTHLALNMQPTTPSSTSYSPSAVYMPNGQGWPSSYPETVVSPLANRPDLKNAHGKRYVGEGDLAEPPPKRVLRQVQPLPSLPGQPLNQNQPAQEQVPPPLRLPAPHLTLNTAPHTQPPTTVASFAAGTAYAPQTPSSNLSLPPLVPGVRAMATVFPPTTSSFAPQLPMLATSGPSVPSSATMSSTTLTGASTPTGYTSVGFGTPTKRTSPGSTLTPAAAYASSSPMAENFPHLSGVHTPISHSPSIYLQQRSSPYKPVRSVNTLLYPPPSASLQEYHLSGTVPPNQMHYQPLGRRNEYRTGIVPEFAAVPYGGAVERGLALTPVHGVHIPTTRPMAYPN